jgi:phytanoyl-CoA hydroxylase
MAAMYHHHPEWRRIGQHPAICEVVASLYQQRGVQMLNDGVWMKPSGGMGATLHQDTGFPTIAAASNPNSMNFWMAIDAATVANGCLFVAPGSHKVQLPHDAHHAQGRIMQADAAAGLAELVPVELEPGDAIFFGARSHRIFSVTVG